METELVGEERQGEAVMLEQNTELLTGKKLYLESYGCQMNFSDSEIVASILTQAGFETTNNQEEADVVLINTCAIRDNAEQRIRNRLKQFNKEKAANSDKVIGILGCMAERLKSQLLEEEKLVDLVAGPDSYRDLPNLISEVGTGQKAVNVLLSREETYADIKPVRLDHNGVSAFISIMRGCDNMCSFCVVPFTRGRERSRDPESIVGEANDLFERGYREVTLLGQNVDSYKWNMNKKEEVLDPSIETVNFAQLMEKVALVNPDLRIRFSTSHPKDMTDDVLHTMAKYENICEYIHLPVQSGNSDVLERMNRGYSREWYLERIKSIRSIMPECGISTDVISGFCGETEQEHQDTISLMKEVRYDFAYMFFYSERPKTLAARKFEDNVPLEEKKRRLSEIIDVQQEHSHESNKRAVGKTYKVLIEGDSKRSSDFQSGRNDQNVMCVFPKSSKQAGNYIEIKITDCTSATLIGELVSES
ncbi:MAG: tRNA (N6-isopentenyl adenosine(37)-C2)-methylthiotransferase MiaB [Flavobacteriales bacterium]|jgi:tRNA-2-methylthio-N6-dimethylallyladenosine synthase|nr:tRNA (N6-isopentenyl adenosine(37)-C2)-methylthiotransferase MiaB [Flavobacteriales bacterium]NCG30676.1 tRNA (N6-isopentenyl adenosine(37)-C2)-methylthiotransferase MiaB [Bacteroidota bacterium]MBT3962842.1 tRNA (N6-isopentenyl adenosine(37)-C2)-methylthiotransferase MiaB [Flavobacteriales bacterium]MBT4704825.1 tRNA (N6-isopentenyl adenosine(37)-C2)-methylthiotransferase MiaB [Flavobacteriales bacterium]MBT4929600.1 tRNA (N6-isopentenyl adenosine(37)-C2)-methylthiotransferase MiaB [Flavoba